MENENDYTDSYVPRFLNEEPVVIKGLNEVELTLSLGIGFVFGLFGAVAGLSMGLGTVSVVLFVFCMAIVTVICVTYISKVKVGKPRGYMKAAFKKRFSSVGAGSLYIKDEPLTVGRSVRNIVIVDRGEVEGE